MTNANPYGQELAGGNVNITAGILIKAEPMTMKLTALEHDALLDCMELPVSDGAGMEGVTAADTCGLNLLVP
jgi:hypothetical protein